MSCLSLTSELFKRLSTGTTTYRIEPYTEWSSAVGVDYMRLVMKMKGKTGAQDFLVRWAIQTALVRPSNPDAWVVLGSDPFLENDGEESSNRADLTSYTAGKQFYRLGVAYKAGSAGEVAGDVSLQACTEVYGKIVGGVKDHLLVAPNTSNYFMPIAGWLTTLMVSKMKAAIIVTQASADFRVGLAYQLAPHSVESPGAWQTLVGNGPYGTGENNTSEQSITVSDNEMWVRPGLYYTNLSGSDGSGLVTMIVGVRK